MPLLTPSSPVRQSVVPFRCTPPGGLAVSSITTSCMADRHRHADAHRFCVAHIRLTPVGRSRLAPAAPVVTWRARLHAPCDTHDGCLTGWQPIIDAITAVPDRLAARVTTRKANVCTLFDLWRRSYCNFSSLSDWGSLSPPALFLSSFPPCLSPSQKNFYIPIQGVIFQSFLFYFRFHVLQQNLYDLLYRSSTAKKRRPDADRMARDTYGRSPCATFGGGPGVLGSRTCFIENKMGMAPRTPSPC
jgi:hypothetical protein